MHQNSWKTWLRIVCTIHAQRREHRHTCLPVSSPAEALLARSGPAACPTVSLASVYNCVSAPAHLHMPAPITPLQFNGTTYAGNVTSLFLPLFCFWSLFASGPSVSTCRDSMEERKWREESSRVEWLVLLPTSSLLSPLLFAMAGTKRRRRAALVICDSAAKH